MEDFYKIVKILIIGEKEYEKLTRVAVELQKLAKEVDCCILVLSQLSNQMAREGTGKPVFEFKGSGALAMVSDLAFLMERKTDGVEDKLILTLKKNRRGVSGLVFYYKFTLPGGLLCETTP